ncbi:MAG: hypothetical protein A2X94_00645 [Bdellovibrionales bacterium GWB1_55_8]|nr:MAG: hypothetical protein A2X94_00645 [Bdellovibrionales bacterium GWB1_55_8]
MEHLKISRAEGARRTLLAAIGNYSHLIWDWNGTLLDDAGLCTEVIGEVLSEYSLDPISLEHYREVFSFPVIEYYKKLGFDFEKVPFETVGDRFITRYSERVTAARLFDGVPEMLDALQNRGTRQWILSAASQWDLDQVTSHFGIRGHFTEICGIENQYAASKVERGRDLMKRAGFPREQTLLIGDTNHDLEVAKELGISALLVADGHQSYGRLSLLHERVLKSRFI